MGSDCAYFSGNDEVEDEGVDEDDETFNFNLEDGPRQKPADHQKNRKQTSESDYDDFENQVIDENDQIVEDFEVAFEEDEQDSYVQSQFDFMYSEDTDANEEKEEEMLRQSIKKREKDFYGDDEAEE